MTGMTGYITGTIAETRSMPQLDSVLIKTASRCNLNCTYCYVYNGADTSWRQQPAKLSESTIKSIVNRLSEFSQIQSMGFSIILHGGEPLLLGIDKLRQLIAGLRENLPPKKYPIGIQTNGILISDEFLDLCADFEVSVSVSIDGMRQTNDIARKYRNGKSSFNKTIDGIEKLKAHKNSSFLFSGTLTVIQPNSDPIETYNFLKSIGAPSMGFLLQDGNHDNYPNWKSTLGSTEYGSWLVKLFHQYVNDRSPVPIRIFDDYLKLCIGGQSIKEGAGENTYGILIVETDGEIRKNDTLRTSYDGVDRFNSVPNIGNVSIQSIIQAEEFNSHLDSLKPSSEICKKCEFLPICGGGMPLYRWSNENGFDNPSVYCEDHKLLIGEMLSFLEQEGVMA